MTTVNKKVNIQNHSFEEIQAMTKRIDVMVNILNRIKKEFKKLQIIEMKMRKKIGKSI